MSAGFRYDESLRGRMSPPLIIKRASASRPSGEWSDDDYDVIADGRRRPQHGGRRRTDRNAVVVDAFLWASRGSHADARL
jgi:hypothetical protein